MTVARQPFSRPIRVESIPPEGLETRIEADEAERAALAAFNNLPAVGQLVGVFQLKRGADGVVNVRGEVVAEVTQICVVTLEPFPAAVLEPVEVRFAPPSGARAQPADKEAPGPLTLEEDEPDPIVDGKIDLGALAAEFLTLGLNPYPRKPGVAFEPPGQGQPPDSSPFDGLAPPRGKT